MSSGNMWRRIVAIAIGAISVVTPFVPASSAEVGATDTGLGATVVSGFHHSCVLLEDQTLKCWGHNQGGQVGPQGDNVGATEEDKFNPTPVAVTSLTNVSSVSSGDEHTCALKVDGTVWCWGRNRDGQLGRTAFESDATPTAVPGLSGVVAVSSGSFHSCALKSDGTVWCWGLHASQQIGQATPTGSRVVQLPTAPGVDVTLPRVENPAKIDGIANAVAIDAGAFANCALLADGTVRCWGANGIGLLGNSSVPEGEATSSGVPVVVEGLDRVTTITVGFGHACARKTSGAVFCWGANNFGQLGDAGGAPGSSARPVVGLTSGVTGLVAGYYHTCAVKSSGEAVCWGANENGQLGNGTTTVANVPVAVSGLADAAAIAPGYQHTCVVKLNQTVACWGDNNYGQVADGLAPTDSSTPKVIAGLIAIKTSPDPVDPLPEPSTPQLDLPYNSLAAPERLLETRPGATPTVDGAFYAGGAIAGGSEFKLTVAGRGTTPTTAATVFLNVTAVDPTGGGYLSVYPCGQNRPNASSVNFAQGANIANAVVAKVGTNFQVCIFVSTTTHLIVDSSGFFPTATSLTPLANPVRLMETRPGATPTVDGGASNIGARQAGSTYELSIAGRGGLPGAAGLTSAVLNVTVVDARAGGYLTVYPCGQPQPNASNVNFVAGQTIPALVVAKLSSTGTVCLFTDQTIDLLVDAVGYFATSVSYSPLANPTRLLETRLGATPTIDGLQSGVGTLEAGTTYRVKIGGRGGLSPTANAVLITIAVPSPKQSGYATVFPCGAPLPNSSNVNFTVGQTIANTVAAGVGTNREICIFVSGTTDAIVDVAGTLA